MRAVLIALVLGSVACGLASGLPPRLQSWLAEQPGLELRPAPQAADSITSEQAIEIVRAEMTQVQPAPGEAALWQWEPLVAPATHGVVACTDRRCEGYVPQGEQRPAWAVSGGPGGDFMIFLVDSGSGELFFIGSPGASGT